MSNPLSLSQRKLCHAAQRSGMRALWAPLGTPNQPELWGLELYAESGEVAAALPAPQEPVWYMAGSIPALLECGRLAIEQWRATELAHGMFAEFGWEWAPELFTGASAGHLARFTLAQGEELIAAEWCPVESAWCAYLYPSSESYWGNGIGVELAGPCESAGDLIAELSHPTIRESFAAPMVPESSPFSGVELAPRYIPLRTVAVWLL